MNPQEILEKAKLTGVEIWRHGEKIRYRGEKSAVTELIPQLREHKVALLEILSATLCPPHDVEKVMPVMKFRLIENQGGGVVIGASADTLQDLRDALAWRYGSRVESTEP